MSSFLSLPTEIRFQIYRELRSFNSPIIKSPFPDDPNAFGYCSFGFYSRILETNRQISSEAKEVFYGENFWTFFASQRNHFTAKLFHMEPMVLILPFIRKAHIRFAMFNWLFWEACGIMGSHDGDLIKTNVREICWVLLKAPTLRTVKIIWTETAQTLCMGTWMEPFNVRDHTLEVLRPFLSLPATIELQKSNIMVNYRNGIKVLGMEHGFSECVDEIIALHRSLKLF